MREYLRVYRLTTELGLPPNVQDDQPAVTLDWLLKIHEAVVKRQRKEMERG